MSEQVKEETNKYRKKRCGMCGVQKGLIAKYKLGICRRCFKQNAERLGFKKFD